MIKAIAAIALGLVLYVMLAGVPALNGTAFVVIALGSLGAFTYKGVIALTAAALVANRL